MKSICTELSTVHIRHKNVYQIVDMIKKKHPKLYSKLQILYDAAINKSLKDNWLSVFCYINKSLFL